MITRLRRRFRLLQAYAVFSFGLIGFLSFAAFTQPPGAQRIDELTVERLNVVDANGTLRLVIANKDRMHPGVMDGVTIDRPRPVAGMIFFNDEGDEVGGLAFTGTDDGGRRASALLAFDQLKQDQTVALSYREGDGERSAGLTVWDRSELPLSDTVRALNAANALPSGPERDRAVQAARAAAPPAPRRLFAGKDTDRSAMVSLSDANGKPRLVMKVEADGSASIEFLDADGKTVQRIPAP
jgi:hypothetical protein